MMTNLSKGLRLSYSFYLRGMTILASCLLAVQVAHARNVEFSNDEIAVYVNPGEPTQVQFPAKIAIGFKNSNAGIAIDKKDTSLILFGRENLNEKGEAILVRLEDGRSYPLRILRASADNPRDAVVEVDDKKNPLASDEEDEVPPYKEKTYEYAPSSKVSGLMREMILVAEFGKKSIPGYQISDKYNGQTVVNDGAIVSKIDKIFIGPNLWGYVLDTTNLLDQSQRINPGSFRIDGTRAISASQWDLAGRPVSVEEQVANKHNTKVYVITRSR